MRENLGLGAFVLTAAEMASLTALPTQPPIWFKSLDAMP